MSLSQLKSRLSSNARELLTEHLIKAVAYCRQGGDHFILFPWATEGDLEEYWKSHEPQRGMEFATWLFTQLAGVAGAHRGAAPR